MGTMNSSESKNETQSEISNPSNAKIQVVGKRIRVVDAPDFSIDELAGNVASGDDRLSLAMVHAKAGAREPWLTLHYDEWIAVLKGSVCIESDGPPLTVMAGHTVFVPKGTRFRPTFPEDTKYIPVCVPAFRPERCIREDVDEEGKQISAKLNELHGASAGGKDEAEEQKVEKGLGPEMTPEHLEKLYHMTTKEEWEAAKKANSAYYPKTFERDGHYTHATAVAPRLVATANHYYQDVPGAWVCLEFTRESLRRLGISVRDEEALPVGDTAISEEMTAWVCPHVVGGIHPSIVDKEYEIERDGKRFVKIVGL